MVSKKGPGASSTAKRKEKVVEDDEEPDFEDNSEESEEVILRTRKDRGRGICLIDGKEVDYARVEEETYRFLLCVFLVFYILLL